MDYFWPVNQANIQPETPEQAFARQLRRFRELWNDEMRQRGPCGRTLASPKAVLSFAEDLILCPTEEAVKVRLQRDREAARGVYVTAGDVNSAACAGRARILIPIGPNETPFGLLAQIVILRAQMAIEKHGDHWLGPEFQKLGH